MPTSLPQIQDSPVVPLSEDYTPEEFNTALLAIMNMVGPDVTRFDRKLTMSWLSPRIRNCVIDCLEAWEEASRNAMH